MARSSLELPTPKFDNGCVYFIRAGRTATVKIGYGKNPYQRLDEMQVGSPHILHLIGYFEGDRNDEFEWHKRFRHLHIRGEWFRLEQGLREAINDRMAAPGACCYLRVAADWRAVRKRGAQFTKPKRPAFVTQEEFQGRHNNGHKLGGSA
jgi:hypothetical protein